MYTLYGSLLPGFISLLCTFYRQRSAQSRSWSVCNGLLDDRAPVTSHNLDNTDTVHPRSYDVLIEGQLEQPDILQAEKCEAKPSLVSRPFVTPPSSHSLVAFAYGITPFSIRPVIYSIEHQHTPKNSQRFRSLSIAVQQTTLQPCFSVERPQGRFTSPTFL